MNDMKKIVDYEIAVEKLQKKSCERDECIASAHVAAGGTMLTASLKS